MFFEMLADQNFDHIGNTAVIFEGRFPDGFLDGRINAKIQGCRFCLWLYFRGWPFSDLPE